MAFDWTTHTFSSLIKGGALEIGDGYRAKNDELGGHGPIFLRAGHVSDSGIDFRGVDRFTYTNADRFGSKVSQAGDVVVTTKGNSTGRVTFVTPRMPPFVYSPHLSYWRAKPGSMLSPGFLKAWSRSQEFATQLSSLSRSTDMAPYLSLQDQRSLKITIPPVSVQQAISALAIGIDDRIDHNRALAANLEAIARALFKSWFVDFDPVRAKAAGEGPPGLAPDLAALFPDRFVDSELGEIPEGWNAATLVGACSLNPEAWTTRKHPDNVEYVDLANVKAGEIENRASYSWDESPSRARRVLRPGDTIVGTVRPGNRSFALIAEDGLTGSTGFAALRPNFEWLREFVYLAATSDDAIDRLTHLADGAAYPAVRPDVVVATEAVIPSEDVAKEFSAILRPLIDRVAASRSESAALSQLRDLLLPRLISGKLRVEDAETALEAA